MAAPVSKRGAHHMAKELHTAGQQEGMTFLSRLARDAAGNTLAMLAAGLFPLLALVGGGIDMGRSYLAQSRLQQACDAGVLAARKKLGSQVVTTGDVPNDIETIGNTFFNVNFRAGAYGTTNRSFEMTLEQDYAISGTATAAVPTTIMTLFGYDKTDLTVSCEAKLNFSNTDVMFVVDVTGSMAETNPGDSATRIDSMKATVKRFRNEVIGSSTPSTRIRFGFVPYSTNVNVGHLLLDDWVVDSWKYQSRERVVTGTEEGTRSYVDKWTYVSGDWGSWNVLDTYDATYHPETTYYDPGGTTVDANENVVTTPAGWRTNPAYYTCDRPSPRDTVAEDKTLLGTTSEAYAGPPAGTRTIESYRSIYNGTDYRTNRNGASCEVLSAVVTNYTVTFDWVTDPFVYEQSAWRYAQLDRDVTNWRNETSGCIEERSTYEIDDYVNVDFDRALDLNIDLVPTTDDATKWRPMYPSVIYARSIDWGGRGAFTPAEVTTNDDYVMPAWAGMASCPAQAKLPEVMTDSNFNSYVDSLSPNGSTYHDIGMIWGGRLLSPTGLFADHNADIDGKATSRHIIFLTDGETAPLDLAYSSYGVEPLDQRRWKEGSALSLVETVEKRFLVACEEVKKRNITIWLVAFGTDLTPTMTTCAGEGRYFQAEDASQLDDVFSKIAAQLGDLRVTK